mmetsp:Transcript_37312/g.90897  ORF Transcript_37312/g.90897 Transcript_37312/m.90897 type:complete len:289 (+) Transcript_37312:1-867(+)
MEGEDVPADLHTRAGRQRAHRHRPLLPVLRMLDVRPRVRAEVRHDDCERAGVEAAVLAAHLVTVARPVQLQISAPVGARRQAADDELSLELGVLEVARVLLVRHAEVLGAQVGEELLEAGGGEEAFEVGLAVRRERALDVVEEVRIHRLRLEHLLDRQLGALVVEGASLHPFGIHLARLPHGEVWDTLRLEEGDLHPRRELGGEAFVDRLDEGGEVEVADRVEEHVSEADRLGRLLQLVRQWVVVRVDGAAPCRTAALVQRHVLLRGFDVRDPVPRRGVMLCLEHKCS